eukprot:CAMPEP_0172475644 /NCGR_PEP_ID=MMETSP1065-20121228/69976_1 /TAXON_ID=265537 /ORGANISM="Amphiprora paludosa, Strain CCMP125" /LENGTH=425 /DNA_ID=CAMNT_0013233855 /DNA_START=69 /DNA_END=1346 /DNA_ORIENTATION=+
MLQSDREHAPLLGGIDRTPTRNAPTRRRPRDTGVPFSSSQQQDPYRNNHPRHHHQQYPYANQAIDIEDGTSSSGSASTNGSHNNNNHSNNHNENGKDRRSWTRKVVGTLNQELQNSAYKVLPPVEDEDTYEDVFNDQPWNWTFGTKEDDGVWMNQTDRAGTIMAAMVWILILYSIGTMMVLVQQGHLPMYTACLYATVATMALASHAKTTFTDPGAVSCSAVPLVTKNVKFHPMCSICQSYKPKYAHHCRICNRCITRMDHHCPWMNNCVGAGNLKHFTLFLAYTWLGSGMALTIFGINYFFCAAEHCEFTVLEIQLVRAMSGISLCAWMFTSSMLMSVIYGMITGVGTIDRLKKKATNTWHLSDEEGIPFYDVFGSGPFYTWFLPTDPFFPDYDRVMGYATTQRLLREQSMEARKRQSESRAEI